MAHTITEDNLGAWLIKARPDAGADLPALIERGGASVTSRCVGSGYRARLMATDDKVALWVSGDGRRLARGIWGIGRVLRPAEDTVVRVEIPLFDEAVAAGELVAAGIDDLEVQRMPAGANPSWVSKDQLARLEALLPPWPAEVPGHTVAAANCAS